jgi:hypothetical protein
MRVLRAFLVVTAALMLAGLCLAETATYTETITASGKVGNTSFTNEVVTLTATGDTSNIFELRSSPLTYEIPVTMTFSVQNGPSSTFLGSPDVFVNNGFGSAGFSIGSDILDVYNSVFVTYSLGYSLGAVPGGDVDTGYTFSTTDGNFALDNANSAGTATFSADVASPTPEPSSLALSASGALGMVAVLRRRFRQLHSR